MSRRRWLETALLGSGGLLAKARAALKRMKITRIRYYEDPASRPIFNQTSHVVTVETDQGITGIGEGGSTDTIKQLAGLLIGKEPSEIEHLWQYMYRAYFYPPGREKIHALGALDMALWDIKGKALGVPVYELLGGKARNHIECYSTGFPNQGSLAETARACIEAGFRAFRTGTAGSGGGAPFVANKMVRETHERCVEIRKGVGDNGDWAIDYHTRFDFPDAVRLSTLLEPLEPQFCEDLVRSENKEVYRDLRPLVKVPIAVGEHFADRWEINDLVEDRLIDYSRVSIPNVGGITEMKKLAALCETHYVGLIPHFTGPIAEASLVHVLCSSPGPALMEMRGDGSWDLPHLPQCFDFRNGKMWPVSRPGLGVELDSSRLGMVAEVTEHSQPIPILYRPDGSITNW
ncbi:MAG: mandelate racemase/muconate lactonizing enzyme family protein [bacterium]|nr:mandelate racemase/muconate lactonizing enzyme family protein [bacterium]